MNSEIRPRLLFLSPYAGGTSEVWMYRQATGLQAFETHWLAQGHNNKANFPAEGFTFWPIPKPKNHSSLIGRALSLCRALSGKFTGSSAERDLLLGLVNDIRPSVAFIQYGPSGVHYAPLLVKAGVPVVVQFNGFDTSRAMRWRTYRWKMRALAKQISAVVVVAQYQAERLRRLGFAPDKLHKIPYGVPIQDYGVGQRTIDASCKFLMVGRLTGKKWPELSIRAFAIASKQLPAASLLVAGDGDLRDRCESLCKELGISSSVLFLGALSADEVRQQMRNADVFVQHSAESTNGDMEGWPVAVAEAAASGLPIVSTRHASIPEQVVEGVSGLLVEEQDVEGMAAAMIDLGKDEAKRKAFGEAARRHMSQFDNATQIGKLSELLLTIAGKNH